MLRYALNRLLWTIPVLAVASMLLLVLIAQIPERPTSKQHSAPWLPAPSDEQVPLLFNLHPADVTSEAKKLIGPASLGDSTAAAHLVRLGGAALPTVLLRLPTFPLPQQLRLASELRPVAVRMGLVHEGQYESDRQILAFWTRFTRERLPDFQTSVARRMVQRQVASPSSSRRARVLELDTFALSAIADSLSAARSRKDVRSISILLSLAAHVTGTEPPAKSSSQEGLLHAAALWQGWWIHSGFEFRKLDGASQVSEALLQTKYGRWALQALALQLGETSSGSVFQLIVRRGLPTLIVALLALLGAYAVAVPFGLVAAGARRSTWVRVVSLIALVLGAMTTPFVAFWVLRSGLISSALLASTLTVGLGLLSSPFRQQRVAAIYDFHRQDVVAVRARGAGTSHLLFFHVARDTVVLGFAVAPLDFPFALSSAFVTERAFGVQGLGEVVVRALVDRDVPVLMGIGLTAVLMSALLHILGDMLQAQTDPRLRALFVGRPGL